MIRTTLQSAVCIFLAPLLVAQQAVEPQSIKYNSHSPAMIHNEVIIPKGTRIELISTENVSSATADKHSVVRFALAKDLVVNEVTVLGAGTPVEGRISRVQRGVPYRRWGSLTVTIKRIQIGNRSFLRLTSSNPERSDSTVEDLAWCALIFPLCLTLVIAFKSEGRGKPSYDGGQAVLPPCVVWTFWTGSDFKISDQEIAEAKAALSVSPPSTCTYVDKIQSQGEVQVK